MTSNMKRIGSRVPNEKKNSNKEHTSVSSRASSTKISSSRSFSSASSPSSKILWSLRSFNMTKTIHPRRSSFKTTRRISSSTSLDDVEDIVEFTISIQTIEDIILNSSRNTPVIGMITLSSQTVVDNRRSKSEIELNVYSSPLMKKSTSVLAGTSERYYGFFGGANTNKLEQIKLALPMKKSRIDNPSSTRYIERQIDLTLSLVRGRGTEIEKVGVAVIKLSGEEFGNSMLIPIVQDATRLDEVTGIHSFMSSDAQSQNGELTEEYTGNPKLRISITARRHPDKKERPDSTTSTYVSKFFPSQPHSSCSDTPRLGTRSSSSSHSLPNSLLSKSSRPYHVMSSDTQSQNGTLTEEYADNTKLRMPSTTTAKRHQDNEERSDSTTSAYVRKFFPSHPHASSCSDIPRLGTRTASSSYSLADSLLSTSRSYDADSSLLFSSTIDEDDSWDNDNEI